MTCHVTVSPPFCRRSRTPTAERPPSPAYQWNSSWTPLSTGHHRNGSSGSALFSRKADTIHTQNLRLCDEEVRHLLRALPRHRPLSCFRVPPLRIHRIYGRQRPHSANSKVVPVSHKEHAALAGPPGPQEQSSLPMLRRVQAGISRARLGRGHPSKVRLPITASLLRRIKHELERTSHQEGIVLWAICCVAFFGLLRLGELLLASPGCFNPRLHLAWGDMAVDNPQAPRMVKFHLKQSKTDQYGRGVDIVVGRTDRDLCPVGAVLAYVAARGDRQGPFFLSSSMSPITKPAFIAEIRRILMALGLPDVNYAGHSFRIGAATLAECGFPMLHQNPPREVSGRFSNHCSPRRTLIV